MASVLKRSLWGAAGALLALVWAGCASAPPKAPYPHESILTVVAELKIFLAQDPYRQAPGQDLNGRNIFRVSLERLQTLEEVADPQYGDVLAYAKGECLERLGDWPGARLAFERAAARSTSLAAQARARAANAARMGDLLSHEATAPTLEGYLNDLDVSERRLKAWLGTAAPWPYDAYLHQAIEHVQEERVKLLFTNRLVLDGAIKRATDAAQKLVDEHKESWRASEHWLLLGSLYESLARDWADQHRPEGAGFTLRAGWLGWIEQARQAYRRVAHADGDPAKLEGQARLRALDAYSLRVQALAK